MNKTSKLLSLNPYLDKDSVLQVGGKLRNAQLMEDMQNPIILPARHQLTRLIIIWNHERLFHTGSQATLTATRKEYWPVSGKSEIKKLVKGCIKCRKASPASNQQIMGQLPAARVNAVRPFLNTGVDYCGPLFVRDRVKRSNKQYKAYVTVFVCTATKAVHLELVENMTTKSFIGALNRLTAKRGKVQNTYVLRQRHQFSWSGSRVAKMDSISRIQRKSYWSCSPGAYKLAFLPFRAPHFGEILEAAYDQ